MRKADVLSWLRLTALVGAWLIAPTGVVAEAQAEKAPNTMVSLVEADNGKTVDIRAGETVQVTLRENATTGFRWAIDRFDDQIIKPLGSEPRYPANTIGVGGVVVFEFEGIHGGTGDVALKYWRHWEGDASVRSRFLVHIHVQPPPLN